MSEFDKETIDDAHLQDTIQMFEQILEVMPDDEMALRTLYDAYMLTGETSKAYAMLQRLTGIVLETHGDDHDMLEFLIGQYETHTDLVDEPGERLLGELKRRFDPNSEVVKSEIRPSGLPLIKQVPVGTDDRKDAELALAWMLFQDQIIAREDYDQTIQDLTVMAAKKTEMPVTVLYAMHDRSYTHFSSVVTHMARQSGAPFLSLANFDISEDLYTLLPWEFVTRNAALAFKMIGNELLVAVLNPFDEKLKKTVEQMTGRACHFYLIAPEDYDAVLGKHRDIRNRA